MPPLLDLIFGKLESAHPNRDEGNKNLHYLEERILPAMPVAVQVKFLKYKVPLNRRLLQPDKTTPPAGS